MKFFSVDAFANGNWREVARATTIGYKRILRFNTVKATKLRININDAKSCPLISNIELYDAPQILATPSMVREQSGDIRITPADFESQIYYILDDASPNEKSFRYNGPIKTGDGKVEVKSIAYDPITKKSSPVQQENFDISRKYWKIVGIEDKNAYNILDGNADSEWYQDKNETMPVDVAIDLGRVEM
ncbi:MAG: FN3 associated domain-containing protein [Chryseolinea sp.]